MATERLPASLVGSLMIVRPCFNSACEQRTLLGTHKPTVEGVARARATQREARAVDTSYGKADRLGTLTVSQPPEDHYDSHWFPRRMCPFRGRGVADRADLDYTHRYFNGHGRPGTSSHRTRVEVTSWTTGRE
jgi:hypothetical protein